MEGANEKKLRVFLIPFFASGHIIPMADLAALFALRADVEATLCLTPVNAGAIRPSHHPSVKLLLYPFPSEESGLRPGQENLSSVSAEEKWRIYKAAELSSPEHARILREHAPDAVITDVMFWWATEIHRNVGNIPVISWHAFGVFPHVVLNSLHTHRRSYDGENSHHLVQVRDIPGPPIAMPISELPEFLRTPLDEGWGSLRKAQLDCYGAVVNSCYQAEPAYCESYRRTDCRRAWFVGPVALARHENYDATIIGENKQVDICCCLEWLDGKEVGSVAFVCFGSWCRLGEGQLAEMAVGLEDSGRPFLWAVRGDVPGGGWEERVRGRGMVVRGWAPQVAILRHAAVGVFLTHCGWNSIMESVAAGVPMLTWPLVFEQFVNERLVVEVWRAGRRVFDGRRSTRDNEKVVVPGTAIANALLRFYDEGEDVREQARKVAAMVKAAVAHDGSSWKDLNNLVDELIEVKKKQEQECRIPQYLKSSYQE